MMKLFEQDAQRINLQDGWLYFDPNYFPEADADQLFSLFREQLCWQESNITLFGKTYQTPRLEAYYATEGQRYSYSGKKLELHPFNSILSEIRSNLEIRFELEFNAMLANLYRNGQDSNGWHADDEPELGRDPQIASISLGATRRFDLKHINSKEKRSIDLTHGSLLIMGGSLQHYWKHQIPKTSLALGERINLTFRKII